MQNVEKPECFINVIISAYYRFAYTLPAPLIAVSYQRLTLG